MTAPKGFTLVEVMVVVTLVAILCVAGSPFTRAWTTNSEIVTAKGVLSQAVSRAKSLAMRNQLGIDTGQSAAAICLDSNKKLEVRYASVTGTSNVNCNVNVGTVNWKSSVSTNITLKNSSNTLSCLCFDSKGQPNNTASGCTSCASSTTITISASGVEDETISLY